MPSISGISANAAGSKNAGANRGMCTTPWSSVRMFSSARRMPLPTPYLSDITVISDLG